MYPGLKFIKIIDINIKIKMNCCQKPPYCIYCHEKHIKEFQEPFKAYKDAFYSNQKANLK